jgi:hypothetical protein
MLWPSLSPIQRKLHCGPTLNYPTRVSVQFPNVRINLSGVHQFIGCVGSILYPDTQAHPLSHCRSNTHQRCLPRQVNQTVIRDCHMDYPVAAPSPATRPPRLIGRLRDALRLRHYSLKTEKTYIHWSSATSTSTACDTQSRWGQPR